MNKKYIVNGFEWDIDVVIHNFQALFDNIGSFLLDENDEYLEGWIYEHYDMYFSWISNDYLEVLIGIGYITEEIKQKAQEMRILSDKMFEDNVECSAHIIRTSPEWQRIIFLADEIRAFLKIL